MTVHKQLQSTIIDKHDILSKFAPTAPIAVILRSLKTAVDVSLIESQCVPYSDTVLYQDSALAMMGMCRTQVPTVLNDHRILDAAIKAAIGAYA